MEMYKGVATVMAQDSAAWRKWLELNHNKVQSVWLIIYKKNSNTPSVTYNEAVDEALCFGWIDSLPNKKDDNSYYQFFSIRNPKSNWSKVNKLKVETLVASGRMTKAGMNAINLAKLNGTWDALNEVETLTLPADMAQLLNNNPTAKIHWESFPKSVKRGILEWILNAKQPETRNKRIATTVALAAHNIRANQFTKK